MKKKFFTIIIAMILCIGVVFAFTGCDGDFSTTNTKQDTQNTQNAVDGLVNNQPTPTDINYSLERYNLIRRAYWVNGQREKAMSLSCAIERPLGYIILFSGSGAVIGRFVVDGKVSSLNSFLTPNMKQDYHGGGEAGYATIETELPDIDGSYGTNVNGIFFFTTDGKYI